jgi:hypothetical protein
MSVFPFLCTSGLQLAAGSFLVKQKCHHSFGALNCALVKSFIYFSVNVTFRVSSG